MLTVFSVLFFVRVTEVQTDEYGVEETVTVLKPAPMERYSRKDVFVPPILAKWLRPHQREGVEFMYQCVMGLKEYDGSGCILADDMVRIKKWLDAIFDCPKCILTPPPPHTHTTTLCRVSARRFNPSP
jgi:hypothetical protein